MSNEPETTLQPSLHTLSEYVDLILQEAESRNVEVSDLRKDFDADPQGDWIGEVADEVLGRLWDEDYANSEQEDTLIIMPKGVPLPEDWAQD